MNTLEVKGHAMAFALAVVCTGAMAQSATVGFTGMVVNPSCVLAVSGAAASPHAGTITLPEAPSALPAAGENTFGKTAFTIGVTGCAASAYAVPVVSISSRQAVGGYIATGVKNLVIELGTGSAAYYLEASNPTSVPLTPSAAAAATNGTVQADFYLQYRAVPGADGPGNMDAKVPTIMVNLTYV
jgi:major type 1 subunit fimbrin (pilin)